MCAAYQLAGESTCARSVSIDNLSWQFQSQSFPCEIKFTLLSKICHGGFAKIFSRGEAPLKTKVDYHSPSRENAWILILERLPLVKQRLSPGTSPWGEPLFLYPITHSKLLLHDRANEIS